MARLVIHINEDEQIALDKLADQELKDPRAQALLIIRDELQRYGLVKNSSENKTYY